MGTVAQIEMHLYDQCVSFVLETRKASTSSLQRKFSLGYNRAARYHRPNGRKWYRKCVWDQMVSVTFWFNQLD